MNKNKKSLISILFTVLTIATIINNIYLLININGLHNIENTIRLVIGIIVFIITLLVTFLNIKALLKKKKAFYIILATINIFFIIIIGTLNINFNIIYSKLNKVTTNYTTYSISLVTTTGNKASSLKDVGKEDLGVINDHEIENGYTFAEQILKEKNLSNKLVEYESYFNIIDDLLSGKISYAFLPSNYSEAFSAVDGYEHLDEKLKTIFETSKTEEQVVNNKSITEPFTILLMGVDGTGDGIANMTANGDSLILVTFNPDTFNVTMLSIPRDSYVPITCLGNKRNKITHSSWGGEKCIINTIQNYTGVEIDYYAKINFNGVVELVDTLGGIDVDIEYSFCEQNSKREFGANMVYVEKGYQTINGEQALAYSRNRHPNPEYCSAEWTNYSSNDFVRGTHQQEIIKAILTKIKNIRDLNTIYSILDTISNNMETNMDVNTILSFYNIGKDLASRFNENDSIDDIINIEKLYLNGYSAMIYDYSQANNSGSKLVLYDYVPYNGSLNDIVSAMKINLGLENETIIKEFNYDVNSPYEKTTIGNKYYNEASITLLPDFTGQTKEYVQNYATTHGLKLTIEYVSDSGFANNTIVSQDPPSKMDINEMTSTKGLKITVAQGSTNTAFDYATCTKEENKNNNKCQFSNYTGKDYDDFVKWLSKYTNIKNKVTYSVIKEDSSEYDKDKANLIESITIDGEVLEDTISIYDIKDSKIVVKYYAKKTTTTDNSNESDNSNNSSDSTNTNNSNTTENNTQNDSSDGQDSNTNGDDQNNTSGD